MKRILLLACMLLWPMSPLHAAKKTKAPVKRSYRIVVSTARLLPVKPNGNCWDLCSRSTARKLNKMAKRLQHVGSFKPDAVKAAYATATRGLGTFIKGGKMPDPYIKISFSNGQVIKSRTIRNTINPSWGVSEQAYLKATDRIAIEVWDDDQFKDDLIGKRAETMIPAKYLKKGGTWRLRFGQVYELSIMFVPLKPKVEQTFKPGLYRVLIHGAVLAKKKSNGRNWDAFGGSPDPYVILIVGRHRIKTPMVRNSLRPQWSFFRDVYLTGTERFIYSVFDKDTLNKDDLMGTCAYQQVSQLVLRYQKHYRHRCQNIKEIRISFERLK